MKWRAAAGRSCCWRPAGSPAAPRAAIPASCCRALPPNPTSSLPASVSSAPRTFGRCPRPGSIMCATPSPPRARRHRSARRLALRLQDRQRRGVFALWSACSAIWAATSRAGRPSACAPSCAASATFMPSIICARSPSIRSITRLRSPPPPSATARAFSKTRRRWRSIRRACASASSRRRRGCAPAKSCSPAMCSLRD